MADRPAVRTIANVELIEVGTWQASTGEVTWTQDDLASAVAAFDDPGYTKPVLKIGHTDPRFDGEPALGRIDNVRLSEDRNTLIGDLLGVPTWLADIIDGTAAFPSRSVEGTFNLETGTGTRHKFALTALSLLGITAPAVSTLADVAALYGLDPVEVAAAASVSLQEGTVSEPVHVEATQQRAVHAGVSVDQVRQSWYTGDTADAISAWAWVREVMLGTGDEPNTIIIDDDEGNLWSVPWTVDGATRTVNFDLEGKTRVGVEYVALPDPPAPDQVAASAGALRARLAHLSDPAAAPATSGTPTEEDNVEDATLAALRERLGVEDSADEATVLAALDEALQERAEPGQESTTPQVPEGMALVDADTLAELQTAAARGVEAHDRFMRQDRDSTIAAAVQDGRITQASRAKWVERWDKAPDDTRETLAALTPGLVPVSLSGTTGDGSVLDDDDANYKRLFGGE